MRVARKIVWVMLATFLAIFAVVGYFDAQRITREQEASMANELATTGRALCPVVDEVESVEGHERALQMVERVDGALPHGHVRWRALAPGDGDAPRLADSHLAALARGENVSLESAETHRLYVYVPMTLRTTAIEVSDDVTPARRLTTRRVARRLLLASGAVLAAAAVTIFAALWIVGGPMRELAAHARRIGAGDLTSRLSWKRRDELGDLANEMNTMCDDLAGARRRIAEEADAKAKAQDQLRHADRMSTVGTLAAGVAHEIGTPLAVVAGRARMIATLDGVPDAAKGYAEVITGQVQRIRTIIQGMLSFARRVRPARTKENLAELVRHATDLLGPLAAKSGVVFAIDATSEPASALVDPVEIEQAVVNVLKNAAQAMSAPGTVRVGVHRVHATAPGSDAARDFVRIAVQDTGAGIPSEDVSRIFEPFFTTKQVGEGTGLGLAVTYAIVQEHGGFIGVESKSDVGTTISLNFPV
jgi:two-component system NtrC family sensor kinase